MRSLILALALVSAVHAGEDDLARAAFVRGTELYQQQRYNDALTQFEEAHRLSLRPGLLYNIGVCHERLGHTAAAVAAFERYLNETSTDPDRPGVESRVKELRARLIVETAPPARKRPRWVWGVVAGGAVVIAGSLALGLGLGLREPQVRALPELRPQ